MQIAVLADIHGNLPALTARSCQLHRVNLRNDDTDHIASVV